MVWRKARKKPVVIEFREVEPKKQVGFDTAKEPQILMGEEITTLESGWNEPLSAVVCEDYIIRGVKGEIYPIKKEIFYETYDVLEEAD